MKNELTFVDESVSNFRIINMCAQGFSLRAFFVFDVGLGNAYLQELGKRFGEAGLQSLS